METSSRPNGLVAIAFAATACLLCLLFASTAQAYVDPPVKLGAEAPNLSDTAAFLMENSPREIVGVEPTMTSEEWYKAEFDTSSDMEASLSAELQSEIDSMLVDTGGFDWRAVPPIAVTVGVSGWAGWEINSTDWGFFFKKASPSSEEITSYPADRWSVVPAGSMLLSDGTGEVYAPTWGLEGSNHLYGAGGDVTDTEACEIEIYGDGVRLYAPGWLSASFCEISKYRNYTLFRKLDVTKCGTVTECPGIETVPYEGAGQPEAPTAEELQERIEEELMGIHFPLFNRFLNHEIEPEFYPDPRIEKKKVTDEQRRCDRGTPAFENPGGNVSPEPFAKKEESAFTIESLPEGVESPSPVYLRWGTTTWLPGTKEFKEAEEKPYLDLWGGWGFRKIKAKHGWNALDREETELALETPQAPKKEGAGLYRYSAIDPGKGIEEVTCERRVVVAFEAGIDPETKEEDPAPRGIVTSFNVVK